MRSTQPNPVLFLAIAVGLCCLCEKDSRAEKQRKGAVVYVCERSRVTGHGMEGEIPAIDTVRLPEGGSFRLMPSGWLSFVAIACYNNFFFIFFGFLR